MRNDKEKEEECFKEIEEDLMKKAGDLSVQYKIKENVKIKARSSGKLVVHDKKEVVLIEMVTIEKGFIELVLSVANKVIEPINVLTLRRRSRIVPKIAWLKKNIWYHPMNLRMKET